MNKCLLTYLGNLFTILYVKNGEKLEHLNKRQEEFIQLGGHAAVVRVMNAHLHHSQIQENGIGVIANLCSHNTRAKEAVGKVRGIQAVVEAMKAHPLERGVIHNGMVALLNLSASNEANAILLVTRLEAVPFIVDRANHFSGDEPLTEWYCKLMVVLSQFPPLRKSILFRAKAAPVLAVAITNYEHNNQIQEHARQALTNLMSQP